MADIDKGLYAAPQGLTADLPEDELDIEVELPDEMQDGLEVILEEGTDYDDEFNANLAEQLDEKTLQSLATDLIGDFTSDIDSRKDWLDTYVDGLELLGMKIEDRTEPWPGACNVYHPLMTETLVKFQAETMTGPSLPVALLRLRLLVSRLQKKNKPLFVLKKT